MALPKRVFTTARGHSVAGMMWGHLVALLFLTATAAAMANSTSLSTFKRVKNTDIGIKFVKNDLDTGFTPSLVVCAGRCGMISNCQGFYMLTTCHILIAESVLNFFLHPAGTKDIYLRAESFDEKGDVASRLSE